MNQHYELCYIIPIKYLEDELQKAKEVVNGLIKKNKGIATSEQDLGKQRLAYPINQVHQGTYVVVEFDMNGEDRNKLDAELKNLPEVLRHLIIKKRIKSDVEKQREEKIQAGLRHVKERELSKAEDARKTGLKKVEETTADEAKSAKKEQKKVTLEELDKKLDELLTEEII
ncbi:MAG: 30S ribosomal protein S6 [Patescibacteria group bacterium]